MTDSIAFRGRGHRKFAQYKAAVAAGGFVITNISPSHTNVTAETEHVVSGFGLDRVITVEVEGDNVPFSTITSTQMRITLPTKPAGVHTISFFSGGLIPKVVNKLFTYTPDIIPLTLVEVVDIVPNVGNISGFTHVIIEVDNVIGVYAAAVGGANLANFTILDSTHIAGYTATHVAGVVDVSVFNSAGTSTLAGGFTYAAGAPTQFSELFGLNLKHLWDIYDDATLTFTDSFGGLDAVGTEPNAAEAVQNTHHYPVFDGNIGGLIAPNMTTLDGLSDWTIWTAIKTNNGYAYGGIFDRIQSIYFELRFGTGQIAFSLQGFGAANINSTIPVNDDQWHRVIITSNAGVVRLIIDGVFDGTDTGGTIAAAVCDTLIGVQPNTTVTDSGILVLGIANRGIDVTEEGYLDLAINNYITPTGGATVVSSVSYTYVDPAGGGERIVVTVDDSAGCTSITVAGTDFTDFAIDDATHVSGVPGPSLSGVYDLYVINATGPSTGGTGLIEYFSPIDLNPTCMLTPGNYAVVGTQGVDAVGTWADISGQGNDAVSVDFISAPATDPSGVPDFVAIDALNLIINSSLGSANGSPPDMCELGSGTEIAFVDPDLTSGAEDIYYSDAIIAGGNGASAGLTYSDAGLTWEAYDEVSGLYLRPVSTAAAPGAKHFTCGRWNGSLWEHRANDTSFNSVTADASVLSNGNVGPSTIIGMSYTGTRYFDGRINAFITYATALSGADIDKIYGWGRQRGIA